MCIIIIRKDPSRKLPKEVYKNCFEHNSDGAGFASIDDDGDIIINKGFFTFEDFWKAYEPVEHISPLTQFRIGTSGGLTGENCHPFRIADKQDGAQNDLVFAHNGVLSIDRPNQNLSDTGNFNELILKPLAKADPDFWKSPEFRWLIESAIGSNNKLVLMDNTGHIEIFNKSAGKEEDGVWYSNNSYCKVKTTTVYQDNYYKKGNSTYHQSSGSTWQEQQEKDEENDGELVDQMNNVDSSINFDSEEGEFAGIDVETIDRYLEEAEKKRLESISGVK